MQDIRSDDIRRREKAGSVLMNVNNPVLIPHLAELLYLPEGFALWTKPGGDLQHSTRPLAAARDIRNIIWARDEFSSEVKDWLRSHSFADVRQLWEQNKDAFLRHDYAAVKSPKTVPDSFPPVTTNKTPSTATPVPTNSVAPPVKQTSSAPVQPGSSSVPLPLLLGLGALVLGAVVAVVILRRKGES